MIILVHASFHIYIQILLGYVPRNKIAWSKLIFIRSPLLCPKDLPICYLLNKSLEVHRAHFGFYSI